MRLALYPHPDSRRGPVTRIEAKVEALDGALGFSFAVGGRVADVRLAPDGLAARADELWRTSCFEAFVGPASGDWYYEFNFSPSRQWAAYRFDKYRAGMSNVEMGEAPNIVTQTDARQLALRATARVADFADLATERSWRIGLSAVIEDINGALSYWALKHAPGRPDFHHRDGFALELVREETP